MTVIDILYYIGLILSLVAIVMSFVLLLRVINADKPRQQDDHDYSDPPKILVGTCNWDEEKERAEKYLTAQSGKGEIMKNKIKEIIAERIKYHSNKQEYGYFIGNACIDICASDILEDVKRAGYQKIDGDTSDGYHTFNELYHHRAVLFAMICNQNKEIAWKSKKHSDGTMFDNMFIVGIETPAGQATYHYDIEPYWDYFNVKELDNAPLWDGHTAEQAIERIRLMADDAPIVCTKAEVVKEFVEQYDKEEE